MCLCRLFILWKAVNLFHGGRLLKNEKSKLRGKGDKEIGSRIAVSIPTQRQIFAAAFNHLVDWCPTGKAKFKNPGERSHCRDAFNVHWNAYLQCAVFDYSLPALWDVITSVFRERFPATGHEHAPKPEIDFHLPEVPRTKTMHYQIWGPIVMKRSK